MRDKGAFVQRLEDMYSTGIPDIMVVHKGITVFIEMKFSKKEVIRSRKIGLRPAQVVWLHKCHKAGGNVLIVDKAGGTMRIFKGEHSIVLDESLTKDALDAQASYVGTRNREHTAILDIITLLFSTKDT